MSAACAISWSAGKDSWLALMRAREQGLRVDTFVTMCDEDGTSKSHALAPDLVGARCAPFAPTEFVFQTLTLAPSPQAG